MGSGRARCCMKLAFHIRFATEAEENWRKEKTLSLSVFVFVFLSFSFFLTGICF